MVHVLYSTLEIQRWIIELINKSHESGKFRVIEQMEKINLFLETRLSPASIFKSDYCRLQKSKNLIYFIFTWELEKIGYAQLTLN